MSEVETLTSKIEDTTMDDKSNNIKSSKQEMDIELKETSDHSTNNISDNESCDDDDDDDDEDDDLDENPLLAGLNKDAIDKAKELQKNLSKGYDTTLKNETAINISEIKNGFKLHLDKIIDDNTANFIYHMYDPPNMTYILEKIMNEGSFYLNSIIEMMEDAKKNGIKYIKVDNNDNNNNNNIDNIESDDSDDDYDDDEEWTLARPKAKKRRIIKTNNDNDNNNENKVSKPGYNNDGTKRCGRLLLNDALKDTTNMEGWSEARKQSYKQKDKKPNQYYYRFNDGQEEQKNGKWTNKEHETFMKRIKEFGANYLWGMFSKPIPNRVGYQCSNYWRDLMKNGSVHDPNYVIIDGKICGFKTRTGDGSTTSQEFKRYGFTVIKDKSGVFKNNETHPKRPNNVDKIEKESTEYWMNHKGKKKLAKKKGSPINENDNNNNNNNNEKENKPKKTKKNRKRKKRDSDEYYMNNNDDNLIIEEVEILKGVIDPITGDQIVKPAISPYGHVIGYESWCKILRSEKTKNICPFTKQKLTRRMLIKLNTENIDQYKDKIINVTEKDLIEK